MWEDAILSVTVDLADVTRARADMPLIADLETMVPHLRESIDAVMSGAPSTFAYDPAAIDSPRGIAQTDAGRPSKGPLPVVRVAPSCDPAPSPIEIDAALTEQWLDRVHPRRDGASRIQASRDRRFGRSRFRGDGVPRRDARSARRTCSACACRTGRRARRVSHHAQLVIDGAGIESRTIDISPAVDGYLANEPDAEPGRRGNVMARMRMITLFDLAAKHRGVPLGTGNKTERLFGYFTWHADDSPPINPLGDLFKTQVSALARHLGIPSVIVDKPPTADLVAGQTDEGDFGITYAKADEILNWLLHGYTPAELVTRGFAPAEIELVRKRVESTHWKRRLPTVAMLSSTAIGESYLRPVDY